LTDQEHLERAYRRLLAWYPRAFRRENGPEILAVLMACAPDGQRRPGLAGSADLIRSGLWMRVRPSVPRSARTVRAAVWLMCAGAAWPAASLIILLTVLLTDGGAAMAALRKENPGLTAAQVSQQHTSYITIVIVGGVVVIALWLWMASANGQGRNWARIVATVLFGLATLDLFVVGGPGILSGAGVSGLIFPGLNWLIGLAAAGLLWLPASTAFFSPPGFAEARYEAQMAELERIRSSRARLPRHI
jgi:hypothetical protein